MHPQVVILSLILHLADSVAGSVKVGGVAGPSVTLPCHYSGAVTSMCWNRGACSLFTCQNGIVWTNGTHVTYQKDTRYKLLGDLSRRDVSLTIENTAVSDSGVYCCRVEHRGWFNDMKITISLEIVPLATSPSSPQPAETHPTILQGAIRTQPTSSPLYSYTTDGNDTVTESSDGLWNNNQTQLSPAHNLQTANTTKGIYAGVCISVLVLLVLLGVIIAKKYFFKKEVQQLSVSFSSLQIKALQNAAEKEVQAEDNIYIENSLYATD
ncbi:hepatitis A virus cellular receptor 1 isoform X2 [Pongo pygmaeus]|uniref:hepatitis A virus cellular receptor 1 isoform X2 n=1 Tax=Pongo pygmaeus TaxID=9600 RepID=UPI00300D8E5D